jgi:hypothetical protein
MDELVYTNLQNLLDFKLIQFKRIEKISTKPQKLTADISKLCNKITQYAKRR